MRIRMVVRVAVVVCTVGYYGCGDGNKKRPVNQPVTPPSLSAVVIPPKTNPREQDIPSLPEVGPMSRQDDIKGQEGQRQNRPRDHVDQGGQNRHERINQERRQSNSNEHIDEDGESNDPELIDQNLDDPNDNPAEVVGVSKDTQHYRPSIADLVDFQKMDLEMEQLLDEMFSKEEPVEGENGEHERAEGGNKSFSFLKKGGDKLSKSSNSKEEAIHEAEEVDIENEDVEFQMMLFNMFASSVKADPIEEMVDETSKQELPVLDEDSIVADTKTTPTVVLDAKPPSEEIARRANLLASLRDVKRFRKSEEKPISETEAKEKQVKIGSNTAAHIVMNLTGGLKRAQERIADTEVITEAKVANSIDELVDHVKEAKTREEAWKAYNDFKASLNDTWNTGGDDDEPSIVVEPPKKVLTPAEFSELANQLRNGGPKKEPKKLRDVGAISTKTKEDMVKKLKLRVPHIPDAPSVKPPIDMDQNSDTAVKKNTIPLVAKPIPSVDGLKTALAKKRDPTNHKVTAGNVQVSTRPLELMEKLLQLLLRDVVDSVNVSKDDDSDVDDSDDDDSDDHNSIKKKTSPAIPLTEEEIKLHNAQVDLITLFNEAYLANPNDSPINSESFFAGFVAYQKAFEKANADVTATFVSFLNAALTGDYSKPIKFIDSPVVLQASGGGSKTAYAVKSDNHTRIIVVLRQQTEQFEKLVQYQGKKYTLKATSDKNDLLLYTVNA